MVPIPSEGDEEARRSVRERTELVAERVALVNRIGAVLATLEEEVPDKAGEMTQQPTELRGIGVQSATVLVREARVVRRPLCDA